MQTSPSRRTFFGWILKVLALPGIGACLAQKPLSLRAEALPQRVSRFRRNYSTHACVTIFDLPIFRRDDVACGCASVEILSQSGETEIALQFAGASRPDRAHGLNRFGIVQETIEERAHGLVSS